jgi:hypothetical protein
LSVPSRREGAVVVAASIHFHETQIDGASPRDVLFIELSKVSTWIASQRGAAGNFFICSGLVPDCHPLRHRRAEFGPAQQPGKSPMLTISDSSNRGKGASPERLAHGKISR